MVAACMESKRLDLSNKALFVVPNHIIEQFASEFLQLYPSANILVATKKDFSTNYRKRFCSKIATGEYDAIIIGHSQYEKIPISPERQRILLQEQLEEIMQGIEEAKEARAENFTIKELQRTKRHLEEKIKKLNDQTRKDNTIYFEELGVDKMFVDEAHWIQKFIFIYKNAKCIWNSSNRSTKKFQFNNLPELMSMFKEIADIQTSDTLNLPVPKANFNIVTTEPSEFQKSIIEGLGERAEKVRSGSVNPKEDNMLKITNDGRKLALDQRLLNDMLPNVENSKINTCADNIYIMYKEYGTEKMAQLVFCDLSTPKELTKSSELFDIIEQDKNAELPFLDVYTDLKCKLMKRGIPRNEIVFIHEADTEEKKKELFAKVRNGAVRVLIGSTQKWEQVQMCKQYLLHCTT